MNQPLRIALGGSVPGDVAEGDAVAPPDGWTFDAFFRSEADRLYGALCLLMSDRAEAEDVMQDAFLAVWERWARVSAMEDPTGYLYRVALNTARKRFRRAAVALRRVARDRAGSDPIDEADARTVVGQALARLTPRQRAAIVLTDLLGYSSRDTSRLMSVREGTVRALASQARAAMRTTIGEGP
jgi:RNA polymerase sigma factor (sigma-70 family)